MPILFHVRTNRLPAVWLAALALLACSGTALAGEAPKATAPEAEAAPAEPADEAPATNTDPKATEPETDEPQTRAEEPPKPPPGQKAMRLEDIEDLPILKRYQEIPFEKGEQFLSDVTDETFGYDESAFWWMLRLVTQMPAKPFDPGEVTTGFAQLLAMPSSFRGKPVTICGAYLTCAPFEPPVLAIRKDVPTLYECNIRELPLEQERPVATVIVTEDPMEYLRVWDTVKVRGYFYKVRRYKGSKGEGLAPMIVSQRLVPVGASAGGPSSTIDLGNSMFLLVLMVTAIGAMMGVFIWLKLKNRKTTREKRQRPVHRFNLRRPDRIEPPGPPGPGSQGSEPQS